MIIRLLGLCSGEPHESSGRWVVYYDPEHHNESGRYDGGELLTTCVRAEATNYSIEEAFRLWQSGPTCACHRKRADGQPNRPLTAFNVVLETDRKEEARMLQAMGQGGN
jgi:hypothetical protein